MRPIKDWETFEEELRSVREGEKSKGRNGELLFRGLSDSTWSLTTTLERAGQQRIPISDYYKLIFGLKPQIESFTGNRWEIPSPEKMETDLRDFDAWGLHRFPDPETCGYMIHLRHHGFPSPLLDWTRSPYVAAFFAFRSALKPCKEKVSIYAFSEMPEEYKATGNPDPWIRRIGPHVRTHRRHFLQQSDYTMCAIFNSGPWHFTEREGVFSRNNTHQDVLWKFEIPWTERTKVLKLLDQYNVNALSLFESEESLMETLGFRELDTRKSH